MIMVEMSPEANTVSGMGGSWLGPVDMDMALSGQVNPILKLTQGLSISPDT